MSSKYIYNDPIAKSLGLKPIQEYYPDYDFDFRPEHIQLWEQNSGELNSFYGKKHTEEKKKYWSETRKGEGNAMYGRSAITEQQLRWYTDGTKNIYVTENTQPYGFRRGRHGLKRSAPTEETIRKISEANKGRPAPNRYKTISPDGKEFNSIKQAADFLNLTVSQFRYRMIHKGNWTYTKIS